MTISLVNLTLFFELLIKTCLPCLYGLEKKQEMMSYLLAESYQPVPSVLAELCLYWPSCSVFANIVTHMIRPIFVINILYYY